MTITENDIEQAWAWLKAIYPGDGVSTIVLQKELAAYAAYVTVEKDKEIERLRAALEFIAEQHDAGRHDGFPEPCPAHDGVVMRNKN